MKKISAILFLFFASANLFSQNVVNQPLNNINVQQQVNPSAQANINFQVNNINNEVNDDEQQVNDNNPQQQQADTGCADCEKIKQLKKLQQQKPQHNDFVPSKVRHHRGLKALHRFNKKMKKLFARSKKNKPDYSCFNW